METATGYAQPQKLVQDPGAGARPYDESVCALSRPSSSKGMFGVGDTLKLICKSLFNSHCKVHDRTSLQSSSFSFLWQCVICIFFSDLDLDPDPHSTMDDCNKNDIGRFVGRASILSTERKKELLENCWTPPTTYDFAKDAKHLKRNFNYSWLKMYSP